MAEKKRILISDVFTVYTVLYCLWFRITGKPFDACYVIEETSRGALYKFFSKFFNVQECPYDLGDFSTEEGHVLFLERERLLMKEYRRYSDVFKKHVADNLSSEDHIADDFSVFLSRDILAEKGNDAARFLLFDAFLKTFKDAEIYGLCKNNSWAVPYDKTVARIFYYLDVSQIFRNFKNLIRPAFLYLKSFKTVSKEALQQNNSAKKKIALHAVRGFKPPHAVSEWDWFAHSGLEYDDILYVTNNDGDAKKAQQEAEGLHVVNAPMWSDPDVESARASMLVLLKQVGCIFASKGVRFSDRWRLASAWCFYCYVYEKWQSLFKYYDVLGYIHIGDSNKDCLPITHALEHVGGVDLSYQFSGTGYHAFFDARPAGSHQYFAWGPVTKHMMDVTQRDAPYRIAPEEVAFSGNHSYHKAAHPSPIHSDIIEEIETRGAERVILVMDSRPTHLKLLSRSKQQQFLKAVLDMMEARPDYFYIFKPQDVFLSFKGDDMARYKALEEQGRVVMCGWPETFYAFLPYVDLAIGTPIYASAVMESLGYGIPAICFDHIDWPHVLDEILPAWLRADNSETLLQCVDQLFDPDFIEAKKADLEQLRGQFNPYFDEKGIERFGFYMGLWVEHIRKSGNADDALGHVMKAYHEAHPIVVNLGTDMDKRREKKA